jgi:glycosyltransferase involved in cell wall biosynthesis
VTVALVHDYLTQRGGAERVVLTMLRAFPEAPVYTSLYEPHATYPEFRSADIRTLALNRFSILRRHHRLSMPVLAPAFSRLELKERVVLCSSSGWSHGVRVAGRKIVYCYTPARWLYDTDSYLGSSQRAAKLALAFFGPSLNRWDRFAAASADRYLTSSSVVRQRIRSLYGFEAEILPPPPALNPKGAGQAIHGLKPGFILCVARLLPYKNVDVVVRAFRESKSQQLVIVGTGPDARRLRALGGRNVHFAGCVTDGQLRWLYENCSGTIAASYEDYGLTPLEAATFGKPSAVLRQGGFLDTVKEGETGVFFDEPRVTAVTAALERLEREDWNAAAIRAHAAQYSESRFIARIRQIVDEELLLSTGIGSS